MHRQQLRKKAQQPVSPGSNDRPSRHPISYSKTRIRGSRLLNAARILALVELTRRLHQAYRFAYDKQAAGRLLPQNTLPGAIDAARDALKDPKSPCAELFSKGNGLEKLNELVKKNKITIGDTGIPKALSPTGKLSGAPGIGAYAKDGKIFLNPASSIVKGTLNPGTAVFGGMSAADALATLIIHDLRHLTKDLSAESLKNYRDESLLNSQDVKAACFPQYKL